MTLPARDRCVPSLQRPACFGMVEFVDTIGPIDQLKIEPLVLNMTKLTLRILVASVQPFA